MVLRVTTRKAKRRTDLGHLFIECPFCGTVCDKSTPLTWCSGCYCEWRIEKTRIITSGLHSDVMMRLAHMIQEGARHVSVFITQDKYHPRLSPEVQGLVDELLRAPPHSHLALYYNSHPIVAHGRGALIPGAMTDCICSEVFITPQGDIYPCGCAVVRVANLTDIKNTFQMDELVSRLWDVRENMDGCEHRTRGTE